MILTGLLLSGCDTGEQAPDPTVQDAWVRLPAAPGRPAAAYFVLRGGNQPSRLTSVSSPKAGRIEMHESRMSGGVMLMEKLIAVEVPGGGEVEFGPTGRHLMLFDVDPAVKPGDQIELRFAIDPPGQIVAKAEVRAFGAGGHEGH